MFLIYSVKIMFLKNEWKTLEMITDWPISMGRWCLLFEFLNNKDSLSILLKSIFFCYAWKLIKRTMFLKWIYCQLYLHYFCFMSLNLIKRVRKPWPILDYIMDISDGEVTYILTLTIYFTLFHYFMPLWCTTFFSVF